MATPQALAVRRAVPHHTPHPADRADRAPERQAAATDARTIGDLSGFAATDARRRLARRRWLRAALWRARGDPLRILRCAGPGHSGAGKSNDRRPPISATRTAPGGRTHVIARLCRRTRAITRQPLLPPPHTRSCFPANPQPSWSAVRRPTARSRAPATNASIFRRGSATDTSPPPTPAGAAHTSSRAASFLCLCAPPNTSTRPGTSRRFCTHRGAKALQILRTRSSER